MTRHADIIERLDHIVSLLEDIKAKPITTTTLHMHPPEELTPAKVTKQLSDAAKRKTML